MREEQWSCLITAGTNFSLQLKKLTQVLTPGLTNETHFRAEYDDYLWRMEEIAAEEKNRKLSSMELWEMLLYPELKMYQGIENCY